MVNTHIQVLQVNPLGPKSERPNSSGARRGTAQRKDAKAVANAVAMAVANERERQKVIIPMIIFHVLSIFKEDFPLF